MPPITRLAPSPTGSLHLGNARTFLINWLLGRQNGWQILLRIEDIDGPRIKAGADAMLMDDLAYLELDWDAPAVHQTSRMNQYHAAIEHLLETGQAYPCICSRREVELAASAPHAEDGAAVYPGTCRGRFKSMDDARGQTQREPAVRFAAPDRAIEFEDRFRGRQAINVGRSLGDFVIAKADGTPAYQLAVVVDDIAMKVTDIVRGDDLLDSTPRQMLLYHALNAADQIPRYTHVPLVVGPDGRRLAKRHGDTRLAKYREMDVSPRRLRQLLARWCGIGDNQNPVERFDLNSLSRDPITFTQADESWLLQEAA